MFPTTQPLGSISNVPPSLPSSLPQLTDTDTLLQSAPVEVEETAEQKLRKEIQDEEEKQLNDYKYSLTYLQELIGTWRAQEQRAESNRLMRDIDIDVDNLRDIGDIDDDEGVYPVRVIDNNIQREMPPFINFLKNSRRIATFNDILDPTKDTDLLEQDFTKGMTFKGWTKPFYKVIDGAMTHGWSCVEVAYDESKPLHASIEYIAFEDLLFPVDSKDIQTASCILRRYKVTPMQLKTWVTKFGFDLEQVDKIIQKYKTAQNKDKTIVVYKRFCKYNGIVWVSWFSIEGATTDWLKKPAKLYMGIEEQVEVPDVIQQSIPQYDVNGQQIGSTTQEIPTTRMEWQSSDIGTYPIFFLPYRETEKPLLFDHLGRVFYDKDKQEGQTAITTAFVNRLTRSQNVYASPGSDYVNDGKPSKQLASIKWADGTIFDKPMEFWSMPPPDPATLKALEFLNTSNSEEVGQTSFAVMNREDSRKTATEIKAAGTAEQLLNSVDLTLFSEFIRDVYSFCWLIVQSQALQNKIALLRIPNPAYQEQQQLINSGIVNVASSFEQEEEFINDADTIKRIYDVRAAGDVDVIQKQELIQQMSMDWSVIQTTSLASRFLSDLLKLKYPQDAQVYSKILEQGDPKLQIIQSLSTILASMVKMPEVQQHLDANMKAQLQQVAQETMAVLQPQGAAQSQQPQQQKASQ